MHAHAGLTSLQILGIAAGIAIVLALVLPASRRWLANVWMQLGGWIDARLLRKHHRDLVVRGVTHRISGITGRAEAVFAQWLAQRRAWFAWLGAAYNRALTAWDDARRTLAEAEANAAAEGAAAPATPQFLPLSGPQYYFVQGVLGCGEAVLTYLALQLWHLSPIAMVPVIALFAVIGALIGHFAGQAIYRRQIGHAIAICAIGLVYCTILGGMRFAYLAGHGETGGVSLANAVGAFGWPLVCLAVAVVVGSQLRYLSALEQARLDEMVASHRCDALNQRGVAAAKALRDAMAALKANRTTAIDAYHRGFSFGWSGDPVTFPEQEIVLPDDELDALWPPKRSLPPPAPAQSTRPWHNGVASGLVVEA